MTKPRHGMARTPYYKAWASMIQRCTNPKVPGYAHYGARGITVCERWRDFVNFHADMGERPAGFTLERIDNDGPYEPGNCRWASMFDQAQNKRRPELVWRRGSAPQRAAHQPRPTMKVEIDKQSGTRSYRQLANEIRKVIAKGEYGPDDAIPSLRTLQQETGLAMATVQHAIRVLVDEGLVYSVSGRGTFVSPRPAG
jgi:hypothetical protein